MKQIITKSYLQHLIELLEKTKSEDKKEADKLIRELKLNNYQNEKL